MSCVFPAFNEQENIGPLLSEALEELKPFAESFEIVVVDDGSRDRSADVVREVARSHPEVRLVSHPTNLGYGHALRTGIAQSRGDVVAWVDGDRQFRIADLALLIDALDGADVVIGRRVHRADPWHRLVVARVYHLTLRATMNVQVHDVDCGFKLLRREVIDAIGPQLESRAAFISPELVIRADRAGYRVIEVPVPHHPRVAGKPRGATPRVVARTIGEIVRLRRSLGRSPAQRTSSAGS